MIIIAVFVACDSEVFEPKCMRKSCCSAYNSELMVFNKLRSVHQSVALVAPLWWMHAGVIPPLLPFIRIIRISCKFSPLEYILYEHIMCVWLRAVASCEWLCKCMHDQWKSDYKSITCSAGAFGVSSLYTELYASNVYFIHRTYTYMWDLYVRTTSFVFALALIYSHAHRLSDIALMHVVSDQLYCWMA